MNKYFTHITITIIFVAKSITFHEFNLSTLVSVESIIFKVIIIIKLFFSFIFVIKSLTSHDFDLSLFFIFEKNVINDLNSISLLIY